MKIIVTVGHSMLKGGIYTSADGREYGGCNEYKWCRAFSKQLVKALKAKGHKVTRLVCPEGQFTASKEERAYKISRINRGDYDLVIELHLNAATPSAEGCEVLYKSDKGKVYAEKVQKALSKTFRNRGAKKRDDLYILNQTKPTAILIETFFCTNPNDYKKGKGLVKRTKLAKDIANAVALS